MTVTSEFELPASKARVRTAAIRIEWITIAFFVTAITVVGLSAGSSQAMRTAWVEDILALVPPIAFLVATRVRNRRPNELFRYGYHRAVSIAYLVASLALLVFGAVLLFESVAKLVTAERPSIGVVQLFGHEIWQGWVMAAALVYTGIPPVLLGRVKVRLAHELHDKALYADAEMNRADWLTAGAALIGVLGIGIGWWWTDALAGSLISLDITRDGVYNLRNVVADLMDRVPHTVDGKRPDPLRARLENEIGKLDWVREARARLHEEGHVYFGDLAIVPADARDLMERLEEARRLTRSLDWRLHDVVVTVVPEAPSTTSGISDGNAKDDSPTP